MNDSDLVQILDARIVSGTGGGPEKTIINSPRFLVNSRYRHLVAYLHPPNDPGFAVIEQRAAEKNCPLVGIPDPGLLSWSVVRELARLCRDYDIRVWHGHDYKTNLLGLILKPFARFRLVTTLHGWVQHAGNLPLYYKIDRWTLPFYEEVIAVSADLHAAALSAGVRKDRLHLIENGIDTEEFRRSAPADSFAREGVPPGRLVIGAVGRLSKEKGFDLLIEAVRRLIIEGRDIALWIAGDGDEKAALQAQIGSSGHGDRIRLLGFQKDTRALFEKFDLFCLSSLREGLPNVVLEAMAMEVPVVATRCGGMEKLGSDGQNCLLVDAGSVEPLADGLRRMVDGAALRSALAAAARRLIEDRYSFKRRMDRVIAVYDRLAIPDKRR
jgi:glycosyltransferase involved in cell wall biosynthesis